MAWASLVADSKRIGASVRRYSGFELHSTRCEVGRGARNGILCRPQRHNLLDVGFGLDALGSSSQTARESGTHRINALEGYTFL
jgi:hypothetical protein